MRNSYHDYPTVPIGNGNPYYMCASCGRSDPVINGRLSKHTSWCNYRREKVREYILSRANRKACNKLAKVENDLRAAEGLLQVMHAYLIVTGDIVPAMRIKAFLDRDKTSA